MIYHFCPLADWEAAQIAGIYTADTLETQGFIHCSDRDTVHLPATLLAKGRTDIVVLEIDESAVDAPTVWEDADPPSPDGQQFPHTYGPIPVGAVVSVIPFPPAEDGSFEPLA